MSDLQFLHNSTSEEVINVINIILFITSFSLGGFITSFIEPDPSQYQAFSPIGIVLMMNVWISYNIIWFLILMFYAFFIQ